MYIVIYLSDKTSKSYSLFKMIYFIRFSILFVFVHGGSDLCEGRNTTSQSVIDYCISQNGSLKSRCCYSSDFNRILAVDLTELNLIKVPDLTENMNFITVNMIDLRLNSHLETSQKSDFLGMQSLDYLLLPEQYNCPGEKHVWQIIDKTNNPIGIICKHQKDFCTNSPDTCPQSNSYCNTNGPNHLLCLCKSGYYGYKCLRYGTFPTGTVFGTSTVVTVIGSVFFYWTQRRHVK
jgi:hypothetical protein